MVGKTTKLDLKVSGEMIIFGRSNAMALHHQNTALHWARPFALAVIFTVLGSGCATRALWVNRALDDFHEPAAPHRLTIYEAPEKHDFRAEYDDVAPNSGRTVRRSYFLRENAAATAAGKKPRFTGEAATPLGVPLPVLEATNRATNSSPRAQLYVVLTARTNHFALYQAGEKLLCEYDLPVYATPAGNVKRLLLTPLTLAADATIVGGIVACALLSQPATYQALANIH